MNPETIIIKMDGNAWCAHRESFINLQESIAGFGATPYEALAAMLMDEGEEAAE